MPTRATIALLPAGGKELETMRVTIPEPGPFEVVVEQSATGICHSQLDHIAAAGLIGNTVRRLLEDPRRWDAVAAEPGLIPGAIEECLRYDPSVPVWRRVTTRPVRLGGAELPEGAKLFLWLAAAGRDPAEFSHPDQFDFRRADADRHLAFGKGLHYCLGANLGKLETQIAISHLARRYPRLRLAPGQQLSFHPNISFRGPQSLMVRS